MRHLSLLIALMAVSACKSNGPQSDCREKPCTQACIKIYQPVCGCNDKTYSNSCMAECHGINDYSEGPCKEQE